MRMAYNWVSACEAVLIVDCYQQLTGYESTLVHFLNTNVKKCQEPLSTFLEQPSLISDMITLPFTVLGEKKNSGHIFFLAQSQTVCYTYNITTLVHLPKLPTKLVKVNCCSWWGEGGWPPRPSHILQIEASCLVIQIFFSKNMEMWDTIITRP